MKRRETCAGCGWCCDGSLIIEATALDVLREPEIARRAKPLDRDLEPEEWMWSLSCGTPCPFLTPDRRCEIYATRPEACVAFAPGESRCRHGAAQPLANDDEGDLRAFRRAVRRAAEQKEDTP